LERKNSIFPSVEKCYFGLCPSLFNFLLSIHILELKITMINGLVERGKGSFMPKQPFIIFYFYPYNFQII